MEEGETQETREVVAALEIDYDLFLVLKMAIFIVIIHFIFQ